MNITAKSWYWQHKGEPTDLVLKERSMSELRPDEVLIENQAIGLNPVDWKLIENGNPAWTTDVVPGVDGAGTIIATGCNMTHLQIGTRVCYHTDLTKDGSFSTHTIVPGRAVMHIPGKLSYEAAAAFPCPALTAWQAFCKVPPMDGKNVLVSGAGGSVGFLLVQMLINAGAKVYATASPKHHAQFLEMGVSGVIDYKKSEWRKEITARLNGNRFDAAFDTVNGEHAASLAPLLGYYGHLVSIQDRVAEAPQAAFTTCISLHEIALGAFHKYASPKQIAELMKDGENLLQQIGTGILKLRRQSVDTFEDLPRHLSEMKQNHSEIKYIIQVR